MRIYFQKYVSLLEPEPCGREMFWSGGSAAEKTVKYWESFHIDKEKGTKSWLTLEYIYPRTLTSLGFGRKETEVVSTFKVGGVKYMSWYSTMLLWIQDTIAFMSTYMIHYCMSKKSWPTLYRNLRNKMGQDFLTVIHKTAKNVVLTNG